MRTRIVTTAGVGQAALEFGPRHWHLACRPRPGAPLGHAGPSFVAHWADGDLLVARLVEVTLAGLRARFRG